MSKRNRTTITQREPAKKSKTTAAKSVQPLQVRIPELNEECLGNIFSYLSPNDLCAVKETCRQFASLVDRQFQMKYTNNEFVFAPTLDQQLTRTAQVVPPKFWSMFGQFIRKLDVHMNNGADAAQHWKGICEKCIRLSDLSVRFCDLKLFQPKDFSTQLHQLHGLHIACFFGKDEDYTRIIGYFGNFECLTVQYIHNNSVRCEFLRHHYPRLKEIVFESIEANEHFDEFIRMNPQIEQAFIHRCSMDYDRLDAITKECSNIASLSIQCDASPENYAEKISRLGRFTHLKVLQFNCLDDSQELITGAIKTLAQECSLETLGLSGGRLDMDMCRALCKLKKLKTLKLVQFEDVTANLLKKLVSDLKLMHLHIIWCDDVKYKDVAVAIKNSHTLKSLTIELSEDSVLDSKCFSQLVNARMASAADFPLEFFHIKSAQSAHNQTVGKQQMQENAQFIKLKQHDGFSSYITNPMGNAFI